MANFNSPEGELTNVFVTDPNFLEEFRGKLVLSWGINNAGMLGDNTVTSKSSPVQTVATGTNWKQISCLQDHMAAIKNDGTLWLWGQNWQGELGDNTTTHRSSPVQTVATGTNWKQVSAGARITAAIKTDGTLWLWGNANSGSLGNNATANVSSPVQTVSSGTNWLSVATHGTTTNTATTAAIKTDGTLWVWGNNASGELGDNTRTSKSSPVQTISQGSNWKDAQPGPGFMLSIRDDSADIFGDPL